MSIRFKHKEIIKEPDLTPEFIKVGDTLIHVKYIVYIDKRQKSYDSSDNAYIIYYGYPATMTGYDRYGAPDKNIFSPYNEAYISESQYRNLLGILGGKKVKELK